ERRRHSQRHRGERRQEESDHHQERQGPPVQGGDHAPGGRGREAEGSGRGVPQATERQERPRELRLLAQELGARGAAGQQDRDVGQGGAREGRGGDDQMGGGERQRARGGVHV